ncbi:MAG: glycosyltransferase [Gemmatimonadales bacterium]|nr:glycosyltransferase [Gemmatimonadales bacterium]NIN13289.1 glycosyltransferase [Gemmatimonadales bacterium]NIN51292.1 glycosyltransferase [Gemmatimonadales bacterium]NIP08756.1 glycosyltransferase [Gemmatimonadales bacterium]NIR02389.1 glycosyltransferase [Gemmatimonadales bacterium]
MRGWDRYTTGLVRALVDLGVEVSLLHRDAHPLHPTHVADLDCEVVGLPDRGGLWWEQVTVPRTLRARGFDLYHAPAEHGVPLHATRPRVLTIHSATVHSYVDLVRRGVLQGPVQAYLGKDAKGGWSATGLYWRLQVRAADHILTPSRFCRAEVVNLLGVPEDHVTATPLAVHRQFLRQPSPPSVRERVLEELGVRSPYLLYVGGYEPHKNVPGVLRVFATVQQQRPDLTIVLVGSKSVPGDLPACAQSLGLSEGDDVVFLLDLGTRLTDLYDGAAAFLTLSWRESFCLPALEAMTRGLPVVCSSWGAGPEVAGDAGMLMDPRDEGAAAAAVLHVLSTERRNELRDRVRQRAAMFSWTKTAQQTLRVYNRLVGK